MQQDITRALETLLGAFANPALAKTEDADIRNSLKALSRLSVFLATELNDVPALREQALRAYAALCPAIEELLRKHSLSLDAVRKLAALGATHKAEGYDAALIAAKDVFLQLLALKDEVAAPLRKQLAMVESEYSERVGAARQVNTAATQGGDSAAGTVIQSRQYDPKALAAFIAKSFPEEQGVEVAESNFISGGTSKYTLSLRLEHAKKLPAKLILRGDSSTSSTFGGVSVGKEYELLKVLYEHHVCVPEPLVYEDTGSVFGSPFMLVERKPGQTIGHMFEMPARNMETCRDVARRLAEIHAVPLDALGFVRGAGRGTIDQIQDFLGESLSNFRALGWPSPLYEAAFDWLQRNIGVLEHTRALVHGDYGLNNLLIHEERVSTILDWEFAHIGNPAYDLGYFYYQAEALGSWEVFLEAYREAGGAKLSQQELEYATLFSVVRLGVMVCQACTAFRGGQFRGLGGAVATMNHMHEVTIDRISRLLLRLL